MKIQQLEVIENVAMQEQIWQFYEKIFAPMNMLTPINQTWPKAGFMSWMTNSRVAKFVSMDGDKIVGFGAMTDQLDLDYLVSIPYFETNHPGKKIYNFMVVALDPEHRDLNAIKSLLGAMFDLVAGDDGYGIFFHSLKHNSSIPRLAKIVSGDTIEGIALDEEVCECFKWK